MSAMTPVDVFNALTPDEKQKVLNVLRKTELTPCEKRGHKYKHIGIKHYWLWRPKTQLVCTSCGKVVLI